MKKIDKSFAEVLSSDKDLFDYLKDLKKRRSRFQRNLLIIWLLLACIAVFIAIINIPFAIVFVLFVFPIIIPIILYFKSFKDDKFADEFKRNVIPKILKSIDSQLSYDYNGGISENYFNKIGIYSRPDGYWTEDFVSGFYHNVKISFSEVHAIDRDKDSPSDIFRGVVMMLDFNKNFQSVTVIKPDVAESLLGSVVGNLLQKCGNIFEKENLIRMDHVEFEKRFSVYTQDSQEAYYILSPKLMEKMVILRDHFGSNMSYVFRDNIMFLTIATKKNFFEMSKKLDETSLKKVYDDLMLFLSVIDELELEQRLWSKRGIEARTEKSNLPKRNKKKQQSTSKNCHC